MLSEKLSKYHATVIKVKQLEKQIQEFFDLLAIRDNPRYDRCADYGERSIHIIIPFDEINMSFLNIEKTEKIKKIIIYHRKCRDLQKKLEKEVNEFNVIQNSIKRSIMDFE